MKIHKKTNINPKIIKKDKKAHFISLNLRKIIFFYKNIILRDLTQNGIGLKMLNM